MLAGMRVIGAILLLLATFTSPAAAAPSVEWTGNGWEQWQVSEPMRSEFG